MSKRTVHSTVAWASIMRRALLPCLLFAVAGTAQQTEPCPFAAPRLAANAPREVAWAAARLTREQCSTPEVIAELAAALRRMQAGAGEDPPRAVLHLLDAAFRHRVALPMADLRPVPPPAAHIPWLGLLVRGATKDGRDLLEVFASLDEATDLGWEYLGDELAARGHATFAVELRTRTRPTLRVHAGPAPLDGPLGSAPFVFQLFVGEEDKVPDPDWPSAPDYVWDRSQLGQLVPRAKSPTEWVMQQPPLDEAGRQRVRLRWLAELTGAGRNWGNQFNVCYPRQDLAKFVEFAAAAEVRAKAALAELDAQLRSDFKLPARLVLPPLEVVWEDHRPELVVEKFPLPARK